jgi:hypothetical protein
MAVAPTALSHKDMPRKGYHYICSMASTAFGDPKKILLDNNACRSPLGAKLILGLTKFPGTSEEESKRNTNMRSREAID